LVCTAIGQSERPKMCFWINGRGGVLSCGAVKKIMLFSFIFRRGASRLDAKSTRCASIQEAVLDR
jgi:hypothetical protein